MRQNRGSMGRPILLVEDEPRLRDMLIQGSREMGFDAAGASSAEQAVRILERRPYPVVIVDLNLPAAGGLEFLQLVRKRWPDTQAIILTGFGNLDAAREAIRLDVVDFLTKPCALGDLEIAIGRAFQRLEQIHPRALDPSVEIGEEGEIDPTDRGDLEAVKSVAIPLTFAPREGGQTLVMEELERQAILATVHKHGGNRIAAAAELGISVRKLYYRLGEYKKKGFPV